MPWPSSRTEQKCCKSRLLCAGDDDGLATGTFFSLPIFFNGVSRLPPISWFVSLGFFSRLSLTFLFCCRKQQPMHLQCNLHLQIFCTYLEITVARRMWMKMRRNGGQNAQNLTTPDYFILLHFFAFSKYSMSLHNTQSVCKKKPRKICAFSPVWSHCWRCCLFRLRARSTRKPVNHPPREQEEEDRAPTGFLSC